MASDNETVAEIVKELRDEPLAENGAKPWLHYLADRIEAAHRREVAELREFANDMRTWFRLYYSCGSDPKSKWWRSCASCRRKRCPIHKWRKALAGARDENS